MPRSPRSLPLNSLPLSFHLLPSQSSSFTTPVACLSAQLPLRHHPDHLEHSASEDLTLRTSLPSVQVVRILDPEHREPFVSLSRILFACSLTPIEGLLRFSIQRPTYELSLGGLAPFNDLWVPLLLARKIATELNVIDELEGLLEWETRGAWSLEDKEAGGIVHNWKIPTSDIDPTKYSTDSMLSTTFHRIHLLSAGSQVRTLAPTASSQPPIPISLPNTHELLHSKLVEWSVLEYETYLDADYEDLASSSSTNPTLSLLSTTILSLLYLSPSTELSPKTFHPDDSLGAALRLSPELKVERKDVQGVKGKLALVFCFGKLADNQWRRSLEEIRKSPPKVVPESEELVGWRKKMEERLGELEEEQANILESREKFQTGVEGAFTGLRAKMDELEKKLASPSPDKFLSTFLSQISTSQSPPSSPDLASQLMFFQLLSVTLLGMLALVVYRLIAF